MISPKTLIIVTILVLISIVHLGSSIHSCMDLMNDETGFKKGPLSVYYNFKYAAKHLSRTEIYEKFKPEPGDSDEIIEKKYLQQELTMAYFMDLCFRRNWNINTIMYYPRTWCRNQVESYIENGNFDSSIRESQIAICKDRTYGFLLFGDTSLIKILVIFNHIYEHWSFSRLRKYINFIKASYQINNVVDDMTATYTENYALGYFHHYVETVNDSVKLQICENLIHEIKLFNPHRENGVNNFRTLFKHFTIQKIENMIDKIPNNSMDEAKKNLQKKVTIAYVLSLLDAPLLYRYFKDPHEWCSEKIEKSRQNGNVNTFEPEKDQVQNCLEYIVGYLCTEQDCQNGKKGIFGALYKNWSYEKIHIDIKYYNETNQEMKKVFTLQYSLEYMDHVARYVDDKRHYTMLFKSINEYCTACSSELLSDEDLHQYLYGNTYMEIPA